MAESKHIVIKHKAAQRGAERPKIVHTRPATPPVLRKQKSKGSAIAVGVVGTLVVLGAGWLLLNVYKQQQREVRLEELALQELRMKAESMYGRLQEDVTRIDGYLDQADQLVAGVETIVGFVTNTAASDSVDAADSAPPHDAALIEIARNVAAGRETIYAIHGQMMDRQPTLDTKLAVALKAQRRVVASAAVTEIEKHLKAIDELLVEAQEAVRQMEAQATEAEGIKAEEIRLRETRAEAGRRQREAEALQQRTDSEVRQVAELVKLSKAPIRRFAFDEALEPMEKAQDELTTPPGREALALPMERLQRIQTFKGHLIDGLNKRPYRWGWGMTAANSQDITGADEAGVTISKGRVEWKDVPIPQLMKMIDYVGKTEHRLSSERATDYIASAILLDELGMNSEACERVREAIAINRHMADDARRLLPDCK